MISSPHFLNAARTYSSDQYIQKNRNRKARFS